MIITLEVGFVDIKKPCLQYRRQGEALKGKRLIRRQPQQPRLREQRQPLRRGRLY